MFLRQAGTSLSVGVRWARLIGVGELTGWTTAPGLRVAVKFPSSSNSSSRARGPRAADRARVSATRGHRLDVAPTVAQEAVDLLDAVARLDLRGPPRRAASMAWIATRVDCMVPIIPFAKESSRLA